MRRVARRWSIVGLVLVGFSGTAHAEGPTQTALPALSPINAEPTTSWLRSTSASINARGEAVVGWTQMPADAPGALRTIGAYVAYRSATGAWSAPERLSTVGQRADEIHVVIDANGASTIAWTQAKDWNDQTVEVVRHTVAGYDGRQTFVPETGGADRLSFAANAQGDAVLAWTGYVPCAEPCVVARGVGGIYAATRTGFTDFGAAQRLSDPSTLYRTSVVASIGARGDVAVGWEEGTTSEIHVRVRVRPAGGAFAPAADFNAEHVAGAVPAVAVSPNAQTTVTWWQLGGMRAARLAADGSVSPVQVLPGTYTDRFAQGAAVLGIDAAGHVSAGWITNDGLWTATAAPGADFGSPEMLDRYATAHGSSPSLAVEPGGGVLLAWLDDEALRAAWRPSGEATFRASATIRGGASGQLPRAALAAGHALLTGWFGERDRAMRLFATVGDPASVAPVAPAATSPADTTPPQLRITGASVVKVKRRREAGSKKQGGAGQKALRVTVSASEAAAVVTTVTKRVRGVRRGSACIAAPKRKPARKKAKTCSRVVTVGKSHRAAVSAGSTVLELGTAPPKGVYEIVLTGTDPAGNAAAPAARRLVIR